MAGTAPIEPIFASGDASGIVLRNPFPEDGPAMWRVARDSGSLDLNSMYSYVMLCDYFRETCLVAEKDGEIVGFVTAYLVPERPEVLFIWQIAVAKEARGVGLATHLLGNLASSDACAGVQYIEATVTPSNEASRRLFSSLAQKRRTALQVGEGYSADLLGGGHEEEKLYRVGPL